MIRYLPSIHDVMPETLSSVAGIVKRFDEAGWAPPMLLVVPGRRWGGSDIAELRRYRKRGHLLAGHGWSHSVTGIGNLKHRLHSALISGRAAEHYSLDRYGICRTVRKCRRWFDDHNLGEPLLYVPPAWGLGRVSPGDLSDLGFRYVETLSGMYDGQADKMTRIPLVGFEATAGPRALCLRASNACNFRIARYRGVLRLAVHPQDLNLALGEQLDRLIQQPRSDIGLEQLTAVCG